MTEFLAISLLILLATISPGPDFAMVTRNALLYSRRAGVFTALGVACSLTIHVTYCLLGLALIISKSLLLFSLIKYLGGGYLIYIGVKSLWAKKDQDFSNSLSKKNNQSLSDLAVFRQGFLCNLLNPKAILFLLAFFTLVVTPGSKSLWFELGYGLEIIVMSLLWFSFLSFLLTYAHIQKNLSKAQFYIVKIMGVLLIIFGIHIAIFS